MNTTNNSSDYKPRQFSILDRLIENTDQALRTIFGNPPGTGRPDPANSATPPSNSENSIDQEGNDNTLLSDQQRTQSAALMRINHCGEVCAQALYQGQALTARSPQVRESMQHASDEENDHLHWCRHRLEDLNSRVSYLNPVWYLGSFGLGAIAGVAGDKWSLGFVAETEYQVVRHLTEHLEQISENDYKSRAVLKQMKIDEAEHATNAVKHGAADLPEPIKKLMGLSSKIMTRTAYCI